MANIRRIQDFQHRFSFSTQEEEFDAFFSRFLQSDLGKIYKSIPWKEMVASFGLKESRRGPRSLFSAQGKLALMFLKNYSGLSDRKLFEQLNGNLEWQFFCGIYLGQERLLNFKIISEIRCELGLQLNIEQLQKILYQHWSDYIEEPGSITMDATCYESHLRFPTDIKLLWEGVDWLHSLLKMQCINAKVCLPRSKYLKWKKRYISYSKMRRKTKKKKRALTRSLLLLVKKLSDQVDRIESEYKGKLSVNQHLRRATIKKVFIQQQALFHQGEKPSDRIVSIDRPYLRPIVRGKEVKPVEFGAKVNTFQVGGISFIEHLSFDAFHEGNRFLDTIFAAQQLTRTRVKIAGADAIYATNKNRKFATKHGIATDFKRKGRAGKHEKQRAKLASAITRERASRLEGSFGKDKEHYHLKRIRARTKHTEILWIFFGIHTGNALEIGRRMAANTHKQVA